MKKFLSLLLILALMIPVMVSAESILDADPADVLDFDREAPVTDWVGTWVLAAAYIGEEYADDCDIDVSGLIAVPENAATIVVDAVLDASATGSPDGVMVDMAQYIHAHVYDMEATLTFSADITDDVVSLKLPWDGWLYTVRGEQDGDFNMGVGKLSKVGAQDKSLYFTKITGVKSDDIDDENVKYMGLNKAGQLIICYSEENLVKKDVDVAFAFIFVKVEE